MHANRRLSSPSCVEVSIWYSLSTGVQALYASRGQGVVEVCALYNRLFAAARVSPLFTSMAPSTLAVATTIPMPLSVVAMAASHRLDSYIQSGFVNTAYTRLTPSDNVDIFIVRALYLNRSLQLTNCVLRRWDTKQNTCEHVYSCKYSLGFRRRARCSQLQTTKNQ